ncbi:hypothetical protein [Roseibium album]|nr:hypothetical protein [Labrenzia sp. EL_126]
MSSNHIGGDASLVNEHQTPWIEIGLSLEPALSPALYIRALLFAGIRCLF